METNKRFFDFKTLLPFLPITLLALSVMAFLSSRKLFASSEISVTDDLEDSVMTFSSAISNFISQHLFKLFSVFYSLMISVDKSLSLQGALGQMTVAPGVTPSLLTSQVTLLSFGGFVSVGIPGNLDNFFFACFSISGGYGAPGISMNDPDNPTELFIQPNGRLTGGCDYMSISHDNSKLLLNAVIYSIRDPSSPVSIAFFSSAYYGSVFLINDTFIAGGTGSGDKIQIVNITSSPQIVSTFDSQYAINANALLFKNNPPTLFAGHALGISRIKIQNLSEPVLENLFTLNGAVSFAINPNEDILYTAHNNGGTQGVVSALNVSNSTKTTLLSKVNIGCTINKIIRDTSRDDLIIGGCNTGIFAVNAKNASFLEVLFNFITGNNTKDIGIRNGFLYAATINGISLYRINYVALQTPTPIPTTLTPPTPMPIAPTNVPPTPVPAAPTNTPSTPDPTDPFNENTPVPQSAAPSDNNETLVPGESRVPSIETAVPPASVQIVTNYNPDNKIQIVSTVISLSLQIRIRPYELGMGEFMTDLLPALGAAFNKNTGTLIITDRSPLEINAGLMTLRFSSNNETATEGCQVVVIASTDGGITFPFRATGNLSQFGSNAGPVVISNNATLINQTVSFGASFAIYLNQLFNDANNDALSYSVISNTVLNALIQEGILGGVCSVPGVTRFTTTATDGYKQAVINNFVTCQYFRPAVRSGAMPAVLTFKAGQRPDAPFSIVDAFTGTGTLMYSALWDGLSILPEGLSFNARRGELSVFKNALAAYNITFTATDIFGNEARATILIQITDIAPVASNITIADIIALAEKTISVMIPNNIIIDPDHDPLTFSIRPAYDWAQLTPSQININFLSLTLTPPGSFLGQSILFVISGFDGYFAASRNVTVTVPANLPPYAHIKLDNVTKVTGDDLAYRIVSGAFLSPSNYSLTYSATALDDNNRDVGLPNSLKFDVDTLFGKLTTDDVGTILIKITAKDTLNSEAFQEFYITVNYSTWELIQYYAEYWGTRVGIPVTIAGILYAAFQYYQLWPHLYNLLFANCYENKNKFEFDGEKYHCKIEAPEGDFAVKIFIQVKPTDRSCLNALLAKTIGLITSYGREQFTLVEPMISDGLEEWLSYNRKTGIAIDYKAIEPTHKPAVVLVIRRDGRILEKIVVNPAAYAKTNKIAKAHRDATRALLVLPEEQQQPQGRQQKPRPKSRQPEPELEERRVPAAEGDVEMQERQPLGGWSPGTFNNKMSPRLQPASVEELLEDASDEYGGVEESYETQPAPTEDEERVVNGGYSAPSVTFFKTATAGHQKPKGQAATPKNNRRRTESMLSL